MTLIGVLLALAAERALGHLPGIGEPVLIRRYVLALQSVLRPPALWRGWVGPLVVLVPVVVATAAIQWYVQNVILHLVFSSAVLLLCLGPRDLVDDVKALLQARAAGDAQTAQRLTRALMRGPEPESSREELLGALFIQSHERLFGVLLWFFAFGAAGAVAYRLASRLPRLLHETHPDITTEAAAAWLHTALAWVPVRVTAALFGLAGSMDDAIREWRRVNAVTGLNWRQRTWTLLAEVPGGSLRVEDENGGTALPANLDECLREVLSLQTRGLIILLALFAVFTAGVLTA